MGCHTWFYKRVPRTEAEARQKYINEALDQISRWYDICHNPEDEARVVYGWTQEECDRQLEVLKRQLRMVSSGLCKVAMMNRQPDDENGYLYKYIEGNLYCTSKDMPHDMFRIGGYPDTILHSFKETVRFCMDNKIKISHILPELRGFWDEYPDGIIKFG